MARVLALVFIFSLAGCVKRPEPAAPLLLQNAEIRQDTVWQGQVVIDGSVKVFKGATLTLLPGTDVAFVPRDADRDGLGDAVLIVEGSLHAEGTRGNPIRFHSAAAIPKPGDWLEIRIDFSRHTYLRYCEIRDSAYTLHAHFTRGLMEDCAVRHNIDGCRLGQARFVIRNSLFEHNQGKGINFRNSTVDIRGNIIRYNGSGIFLFENDRAIAVSGNNFYGNQENFRLGDFYTGDVALSGNWWGTADREEAGRTVFDRKYDPTIGTVTLQPAGAWISGTGPREALALKDAWTFPVGGYVDASPRVLGDALFTGAWDGRLYAQNRAGGTRWSRDLEDVIDSAVAVDERAVYVQTWGREVFALDRYDGRELWRQSYEASPADDHRQGGVVRAGDLLLVPAWNGTLFAFNRSDGARRWSYASGHALRATPLVVEDRVYLADSGGTLTALDLNGAPLWRQRLAAGLLAAPALIPDGVVVVDREGTLTAFDRAGEFRWQRHLQQVSYYGAPVVEGAALYIGTAGGTLWKLDVETGAPVWSLDGLGPVYATPLVTEGRLYIGDNDGVLHVVGTDNGDLLAAFPAAGAIQSTPVFYQGRLVFGSRLGAIHALDVEGVHVPGDKSELLEPDVEEHDEGVPHSHSGEAEDLRPAGVPILY